MTKDKVIQVGFETIKQILSDSIGRDKADETTKLFRTGEELQNGLFEINGVVMMVDETLKEMDKINATRSIFERTQINPCISNVSTHPNAGYQD